MTGRARRAFHRLVAALGIPIALFGIVDLAVPLLDFVPVRVSPILFWGIAEESYFDGPESPFRPNPDLFWEPRPGGIFEGERINEDGMRGPRIPRARGDRRRLRLAALGDSSTMGYGVSEAEAWPRRLEEELRARGHDAEVINFGVVGYSFFQGRAIYLDRVRDWDPDVVVAAFGAINDQFLNPQGLDDATKSALLRGTGARVRHFLSRFGLFRWLESRLRGTKPSTFAEPVPRVRPEEFQGIAADLARAQASAGGRFVLVSPPRMEIAEELHSKTPLYTGALQAAAAELGLPIADVYAAFRAHERATRVGETLRLQNDWFLDTVHPTVAGHVEYARIVAEALIASGVLQR